MLAPSKTTTTAPSVNKFKLSWSWTSQFFQLPIEKRKVLSGECSLLASPYQTTQQCFLQCFQGENQHRLRQAQNSQTPPWTIMETWWIGNMFDFPEGHGRRFWVSPTAGSAANSKRSPSERPKPEVCWVLAGAKAQSQKQPLRNPPLSLSLSRYIPIYILYIYNNYIHTCNTCIYVSLFIHHQISELYLGVE